MPNPFNNPDFYNNLMQFGFGAMAAGAQPGATTLGALGQGGLQAMKSAQDSADSRIKNQYYGQEILKSQLDNAAAIRGLNARNEFFGLPTIDKAQGIPDSFLGRDPNSQAMPISALSPAAGGSVSQPQTKTVPASESNMQDYNIKAVAYGNYMPKTKEEALAALNMEGISKQKSEILIDFIKNSDPSYQFNPVSGNLYSINKRSGTVNQVPLGDFSGNSNTSLPTATINGLTFSPPADIANNPKALQNWKEKVSEKQIDADLERKKKRGELEIPGVELIEGITPNDTAVNNAREQVATRDKYAQIINRLNSYFDTHGMNAKSAVGVGSRGTDEYKAVQSIISDLRNLERHVNQTGVLNVGEVPFLEQAYALFDPSNVSNVTTDITQMKNNARGYLNNRLAQIDANLKSLGYRQKLTPVPPELKALGITEEDLKEYLGDRK